MSEGFVREDAIARYICRNFAGITPVAAWGETSFFYNPGKALSRGVYFATLKAKDGDNDKASRLDRDDVFRLNFGISKATYQQLLGPLPKRPGAGGVVATGHDFEALDVLLPHPVYGWMAWVSVLNPSPPTFDAIKPLLAASYELSVTKFRKRVPL
jgi:hypothetical protein